MKIKTVRGVGMSTLQYRRYAQPFAEMLVDHGEAVFSTKGAYKSWLRRRQKTPNRKKARVTGSRHAYWPKGYSGVELREFRRLRGVGSVRRINIR